MVGARGVNQMLEKRAAVFAGELRRNLWEGAEEGCVGGSWVLGFLFGSGSPRGAEVKEGG